MTVTPGRLVATLTPLVFAPLAGTVSVLAAKYLPGVTIDSDQLQQIFIAGAVIAFGKAGLWLKGWQDWEKQDGGSADVTNDVALEASMDGEPEGSVDPDEEAALADGMDPDEDDADDDDGDPLTDDEFAAVGRD
jgi:hypothetical protein